MKSPCSLQLRLFFPTEKEAKIIFRSISPEFHGKHEKRARTAMDINKNVLSLQIDATDATALKASLNSYMKLIILGSNIINGGI